MDGVNRLEIGGMEIIIETNVSPDSKLLFRKPLNTSGFQNKIQKTSTCLSFYVIFLEQSSCYIGKTTI